MSIWYIVYGNRDRSLYDFEGLIKICGKWYNILYDVGFRILYFEEKKKYKYTYLDIIALNEKFVEENMDSIMEIYRSIGPSNIHHFYYELFRLVRWGYMVDEYNKILDLEIYYPDYETNPAYVLEVNYYVRHERKQKLSCHFIAIGVNPDDLETIRWIFFSHGNLKIEGKELELIDLTKFDDLRGFPTVLDLQNYIVERHRELEDTK